MLCIPPAIVTTINLQCMICLLSATLASRASEKELALDFIAHMLSLSVGMENRTSASTETV